MVEDAEKRNVSGPSETIHYLVQSVTVFQFQGPNKVKYYNIRKIGKHRERSGDVMF
jgi:hypothetical protein